MPSTPPDLLPAHEIFKDEKPGIRYYKILKTLRKFRLVFQNGLT